MLILGIWMTGSQNEVGESPNLDVGSYLVSMYIRPNLHKYVAGTPEHQLKAKPYWALRTRKIRCSDINLTRKIRIIQSHHIHDFISVLCIPYWK